MNQAEMYINNEVIGIPAFEVISRTGDMCSAYDGRGNLIYRNNDVKDEGKEKVSWRNKYFARMGATERNLVASWHSKFEYDNNDQKIFWRTVGEALLLVNYDYDIAMVDPSMDENGKLFFQDGESVCEAMNCFDWEKKAKEFAPEANSELASLHELFMWYAYCIATEKKTIHEVCDIRYQVKNYLAWKSDSPEDKNFTKYKIVKSNSGFAMCGGRFFSSQDKFNMSDIGYVCFPEGKLINGAGTVVLKK